LRGAEATRQSHRISSDCFVIAIPRNDIETRANMKKKGFTLIELVVAMAIMLLIASVVMFALLKSKSKVRDQQRIAELNTIAQAMSTYYSDYQSYPYFEASKSKNGIFSRDENGYCFDGYKCIYSASQGSSWRVFLDNYLKNHPTSPKKGLVWQYFYSSSGSDDTPPSNYAIGVKLEVSNYRVSKTKTDAWYSSGYCQAPNCTPVLPKMETGWYYYIGN